MACSSLQRSNVTPFAFSSSICPSGVSMGFNPCASCSPSSRPQAVYVFSVSSMPLFYASRHRPETMRSRKRNIAATGTGSPVAIRPPRARPQPPASSMPGCSAGNRTSRKGRENFSARVPYALRPSPYLRDAEPRPWGEHQDRIGALRSREHRYTLDLYAGYVPKTGVELGSRYMNFLRSYDIAA